MDKDILLKPTFEPWRPDPGKKAIAVFMSGGVDSSVTALLLKESGWDVVGITMKIPAVAVDRNNPRPCCGAGASVICRDLDIPHYFMYVQEVFYHYVVRPFRESYACGYTPSPCVDCNTFVKFGAAWDVVEKRLGIRHVATGHYARVLQGPKGAVLATATDPSRDQSYFLYGIPRKRLDRFVLPLGEKFKSEVRAIAREKQLQVAEKPDSMELCFAGEGDYRLALADTESNRPGPIIDMEGNILGQHQGIACYTIGQRRGLGLAASEPLYVLDINAEKNVLVAGPKRQAFQSTIQAERINLLMPETFQMNAKFFARIRSTADLGSCRVSFVGNDWFEVRFDQPVFAPAAGQHLVVYDHQGHVVVGGVIRHPRSE